MIRTPRSPIIPAPWTNASRNKNRRTKSLLGYEFMPFYVINSDFMIHKIQVPNEERVPLAVYIDIPEHETAVQAVESWLVSNRDNKRQIPVGDNIYYYIWHINTPASLTLYDRYNNGAIETWGIYRGRITAKQCEALIPLRQLGGIAMT